MPTTDTHMRPESLGYVGDPIPTTLTDLELRLVLRISHSTFYRYKSRGEFRRFEVRHPIGPRLYSGQLVKEYLEGPFAKRRRGGL